MLSYITSFLEFEVPANDRGAGTLAPGGSGVSIAVKVQPALYVGKQFSNCIFILDDKCFENLNATVVHRSPDCDDTWICRISLSNIGVGSSAKIDAYLSGIPKEMFVKDVAFGSWR